MKTNSKKLTMKRETISALNARQLEAVVGGSNTGSSTLHWTVIACPSMQQTIFACPFPLPLN
jgi:hypothetical protein